MISEVNRLRSELGPRSEYRKPEFLAKLADRLTDSPALLERPLVRALIDDIREFPEKQRLSRTKALVNGATENSIAGLFNASYFPSLSLEYLQYRTLPVDEHLAERYASPTMPIVIENMSEGFRSRTVVALFPENQLDGHQDPQDLIFYFIDKFVERHQRLTLPLIEALMEPGAFPLVRAASEPMMELASSWWVRMHEYHHREGDLPIPKYLSAKSIKPLAGLEELRTDVSSMLACLSDHRLPRETAELTYQFILSERLLRYAVEGIPRPNYDAVASQVLFTYLAENSAISIEDGRIHLSPDLPATLRCFLDEIQSIESLIHEHELEDVRTRLLAFVNRYTDFDEEAKDYRHISFFAEAKERLGF
ncbi:DUF6421 family protein [Kribbella sp. NPDC051718]|uniref:DUF6421 family protein n=1 Tax=Kribbella sp. NPDC051718 TaxID=3155168 RepID=UPI003433332D